MARFRVPHIRGPRKIHRDRKGRFARSGVVQTVGTGAGRISAAGKARKKAWVIQPNSLSPNRSVKKMSRNDSLHTAHYAKVPTRPSQVTPEWAKGQRQLAKAKGQGWRANKKHVVPYSRTSLRAQTVGVNVGHRISKNYKVSYGSFARVERVNPTQLEKKLREKDEAILNRAAHKFSPHHALDPYYKQGIRNFRRNVLDAFVGQEKRLGKGKVYGSLATDMNAMPVVLIRKNRRSYQANRRKALYAYNDMVQKNKLEGMKVGKFRESRRKKGRR